MTLVYIDSNAVLIRQDDRVVRANRSCLERLFLEDAAAVIQEILDRGEEIDPATIDWEHHPWQPPLTERTEVWAAGVTYYRSRVARMEESEESGGKVFYDMVYDADRPELFFKSTSWNARGHRAAVRCRADSSWDVPEPELTLAINRRGEIFGYTIGNDMSSRSIEGENPLYLPQAKFYRGSCAVGPCLLLGDESLPAQAGISVSIRRGGEEVFSGSTDITQIKREFTELAEYLFRENDFPAGALLMTGTGVVPDADFTLQSGDGIQIAIDGIGTLFNEVE